MALDKDHGQFADSTDWHGGGVDGPFDGCRPMGRNTVAETIALASARPERGQLVGQPTMRTTAFKPILR